MARVFIVDDDVVTAEAIAATLAREGHELIVFADPREALEGVLSEAPAVVITDFAMPGMNGLEFLLAVRQVSPAISFVVVSGQATVEDAVSLMKHGVVDVLVKPPRTPALRKVLALALAQHELAAENLRLRQALRERRHLSGVIGTSPAFEAVLRLIEKVAPSPATIMINGETGTGKEVLAEAIHELSPRAERRLVKLHCAALPPSLIESELFGHTRGAFTGAIKDKPGLFEAADGGTMFLDEIAELTLETQVKLLRVLQTGEFQRIGETRTRRVDVRTLAATHRDLEVEIGAGRFREDLFFRLNVIALRVPPLRQRGDDILLLANHFLARDLEAGNPRGITGLSPEASAELRAYGWPGNVRELENAITRAAALAEGPLIQPDDLPDSIRRGGAPADGAFLLPESATLAEAEQVLIRRALDAAQGNKKDAAKRLGISLATLYRKLAADSEGQGSP